MSSVSLSPPPTITASTSTPTPTPTPKAKRQEDQYESLTRDSDDDNISLAKCMTRRLQSNQQMYPWMSPALVALHQQHDSPASRDSTYAINKSSYTQYHQIQLQLQLQYQQQLTLHYQQQQQQQQQSLVGFNGQSLRPYHRHHHHHPQQRNPGAKQQPIVRKSRSSQLDDSNHDLQTRMSSTNFSHRPSCSSFDNSAFSSTDTSKRDSQHHRLSLLSLPSDSTTQNHHLQRGYQQQQQMNSSTKQSATRGSSIYSHAYGTSTSTAPASNSTNTTPSSGSNSKSQSRSNKPSLSKRLRGVILGRSTNSKQAHTTSSSAPSSLRRSSSVVSGTSSVSDNGYGSSRSLWTTLVRKSSRSGPANYDVEKQLVHGKRSNGRKDVAPDSPASSVSGSSYHRSFLHHENGLVDDLPSPASSTPPDSPIDQSDYFGQSSALSKINSYSLQHGSPRLHPSSNHHQNRNSLVMSESDDLSTTCFLETPIPNHSSKSSLPPPVSSSASTSLSSSVSTSTSSLALNHQQSDNTKPSTKSFSTKSNTRIQFAKTIQVYDTFGSQEYDRRCDTQVTCQRLTTILALQIKKELNEYKLNEMQVHLHSRKNTQFFL